MRGNALRNDLWFSHFSDLLAIFLQPAFFIEDSNRAVAICRLIHDGREGF